MGNRLDSLATPPLLATHGVTCACRACASGSYQELLTRSDYQRHEITRLTTELKAARHALACERYRRLTLVIAQAVAAGDRSAWAAAVAERMQLGMEDADLVVYAADYASPETKARMERDRQECLAAGGSF